MKSNLFFKTESNNYFLNKRTATSSIVHPIMERMFLQEEETGSINKKELLKEFDEEQVEYYSNKYDFWKGNGLISKDQETQHEAVSEVTRENVINDFINTDQITFEVTERCNIDCDYCAYGSLYNSYDKRYNKKLAFQSVKLLLDRFVELRKSKGSINYKKKLFVSFYGGEPLMNIEFIKKTVNYFSEVGIEVTFSMTTNGLLLRKHIDFLVENKFKLLISLDGNESHNQYRKLFNGKDSYDLVYQNIKYVQTNHPLFFDNNVNFNTVITNLSDEEEITKFFHLEFNKTSNLSALNPAGIEDSKVEEFNNMFKPIAFSKKLEPKPENTIFLGLAKFLREQVKPQLTSFTPRTEATSKFFPSGTCTAFSKRIFITANGYIFACEKIDHKYKLGSVSEDQLDLDFDFIAEEYSAMYRKIINRCKNCYRQLNCPTCVLYNDAVDKGCELYLSRGRHVKELGQYFALLEKKPETIADSFQKITLE
jgi:uncharacterized protein